MFFFLWFLCLLSIFEIYFRYFLSFAKKILKSLLFMWYITRLCLSLLDCLLVEELVNIYYSQNLFKKSTKFVFGKQILRIFKDSETIVYANIQYGNNRISQHKLCWTRIGLERIKWININSFENNCLCFCLFHISPIIFGQIIDEKRRYHCIIVYILSKII